MSCELRDRAEELAKKKGLILKACPYVNVCNEETATVCPEMDSPVVEVKTQTEKFNDRLLKRGKTFLEKIGRLRGDSG